MKRILVILDEDLDRLLEWYNELADKNTPEDDGLAEKLRAVTFSPRNTSVDPSG